MLNYRNKPISATYVRNGIQHEQRNMNVQNMNVFMEEYIDSLTPQWIDQSTV